MKFVTARLPANGHVLIQDREIEIYMVAGFEKDGGGDLIETEISVDGAGIPVDLVYQDGPSPHQYRLIGWETASDMIPCRVWSHLHEDGYVCYVPCKWRDYVVE